MAEAVQISAPRMHEASQSTPAQLQAMRLGWLVKLRWLYLAAGAAVTAVVSWRLPDANVTYAMAGLCVAVAGYNVVFTRLIERAGLRHEQAALRDLRGLAAAQIAMDLVVLLCFAHLTGGAYSVILAVVVFHLAVAASVLPLRLAYVEAAWASVLLAGLVAAESLANLRTPLTGLLGTSPLALMGELRPVNLALTMLGGLAIAGGSFFGVVFFVDAILERLRRINRRVVEANRQLAGLDLAKSRFLRISAHQLRGPLAAVHTLISAVQEVGQLNPRQQDLLQKVHARSDEMMTQVDEMMTLSTVQEHASETLSSQVVDVGQVVEQSVEEFAAEARQKGLSLTFSGNGSAKILAWEDALETVLEHLISNALKYTPSGGSVAVRWSHNSRGVCLEIADTGIGVPPDQQCRLFHEFFRATNARQIAGGTGLGLSIVKAIVERLGGSISLESSQGLGTRVNVCLPEV